MSHFTAALTDLFNVGVTAILDDDNELPVLREEVRLTLREIRDLKMDPFFALGDFIFRKRDISFQDMQSTFRAFRDCAGVEPARNEHVDNIIVGQAARHIIVHNSGVVNDICVRRTEKARIRSTITLALDEGQPVQFTPETLEQLGDSMVSFMSSLALLLDSASQHQSNQR